MKINVNNSDIAMTVGSAKQFPRDPRPQIALSGRSNEIKLFVDIVVIYSYCLSGGR